MLTVEQLLSLPELGLTAAAGRDGLGHPIRWIHVSELADPTPWLEGGELLLTTGLGIRREPEEQVRYLRALAGCDLAGLGLGLGFGFAEVPRALREEGDRLGLPVLAVPFDVPFMAITKAAFASLANERLQIVTTALAVQERLAQAVLDGRSLHDLLAIVTGCLGCSIRFVDGDGHVLGERHAGVPLPFDDALELPVVCAGEIATLRAARAGRPFEDFDRLVLHHAQTALAFELSRRRAVTAAELRLAGDLIEDLERDRLSEREIAMRTAAFGLDHERPCAALLASPPDEASDERLRQVIARLLDARGIAYVSTRLRHTAAFLIQIDGEEEVLELAAAVAAAEPEARVAVGRPATGRGLGRTLVEARAALETAASRVASYRDLGALELLLALPQPSLEAFVDRVLGPAASNPQLVTSLAALLDAGCCWTDAAEALGVHRHTLRYRMARLRDQTGRHPDDRAGRMDLWLAVKALHVLGARPPGGAEARAGVGRDGQDA